MLRHLKEYIVLRTKIVQAVCAFGRDKRRRVVSGRRLPIVPGSASVALPPSAIMGFSAHRLSKVARTTCAPFTAVLAFSFLLTVVFILYQPTRGPGNLQKLGWQSWASVSPKPVTDDKVTLDNTDSSSVPQGTDWWDVEAPEPEIESSSLPLDVWDPLMPHDTGRTSTC